MNFLYSIKFNIELGYYSIDNYDNVEIVDSQRTNTALNNMYIMARNISGTVGMNSKLKLYTFNIYENNSIVRNYIPCYRKSDNKKGLYDVVEGKFYTNAATTGDDFSVGNNVNTYDTYILQTSKVALTQNHTLTAIWEANDYTVTANANGGTIPSTTGWTGTGATSTKSVTYDSTYGTLPTPTRTGYTFKGWHGKNLFDKSKIIIVRYTMLDGEKFVFDGSGVSGNRSYEIRVLRYINDTHIDSYNVVTLAIGRYSFSFTKTSSFNKLRIIENTSKSDPGFDYYIDFLENGKTYTMSYNIDSFNASSAKATISNIQIEEGTTSTTYEPYYVTSSTTVTQAKNHTLTAIWEANDYTVTANANGGTIPSTTGWTGTGNTSTKSVTYNSAYGTLPTPTREGYDFMGWNGKNKFDKSAVLTGYEIAGSSVISNNSWYVTDFISVESGQNYVISGKSTGNERLLYDENKNFLTNDTDGSNGVKTFSSNVKYIKLNGTLETLNTFQFEEGTTSTTYEPYYVTSSTTVTQAKNHTLTAIWKPKTYTATFSKGSNTSSIGSTAASCTISGNNTTCTVSVPSITASEGYVGTGWSKSSGSATPNSVAVNGTITLSGDATYTSTTRIANSTEVSYSNTNTGLKDTSGNNCTTSQCALDALGRLLQ